MQTFQDLNESERQWLTSCIEGGKQLVTVFSPSDSGQPITVAAHDRAYAGWLSTNESDGNRVNEVINSIGFAFGQLLVDEGAFQWVVVNDQFGTDVGIRALPGKADVLVCPSHLVLLSCRRIRPRDRLATNHFRQFLESTRQFAKRPARHGLARILSETAQPLQLPAERPALPPGARDAPPWETKSRLVPRGRLHA